MSTPAPTSSEMTELSLVPSLGEEAKKVEEGAPTCSKEDEALLEVDFFEEVS